MKKDRTTQTLFSALILLTLFIFIGCKNDSSSPGKNEVVIVDMKFMPSNITVPINTTVTWTNNDGMAHTVTSNTDLFDSGSISDGNSFSYTFTTAGTYSYKCLFHPSMTGSVVVTAK